MHYQILNYLISLAPFPCLAQFSTLLFPFPDCISLPSGFLSFLSYCNYFFLFMQDVFGFSCKRLHAIFNFLSLISIILTVFLSIFLKMTWFPVYSWVIYHCVYVLYLVISRHLEYFHSFAIMNATGINKNVQVSLKYATLDYFRNMPKTRYVCLIVFPCIVFWEIFILTSVMAFNLNFKHMRIKSERIFSFAVPNIELTVFEMEYKKQLSWE